GHAQVGAQGLQPVAHLDEAAFDERAGHPRTLPPGGAGTRADPPALVGHRPYCAALRSQRRPTPGVSCPLPTGALVVLATADARRGARLPLRWFVLFSLLAAFALVALGVRAGLIDPSFLRLQFGAETTVEADPTVILTALTEEADLVVAERNVAPTTVEADNAVTVQVPLLGSQRMPSALAGEREVAEVDPGRVELRVDLDELSTSDIVVQDGTVRITAP